MFIKTAISNNNVVNFLVVLSTPQYHHSTDGYIRIKHEIDRTFDTYDEAYDYCMENYNPHELTDFDMGYAYILVDVFRYTYADPEDYYVRTQYTLDELTPNSHYTGPVTNDNTCPWPF